MKPILTTPIDFIDSCNFNEPGSEACKCHDTGTAVFGYNQGQVAPLFYPEVLELTKDLGKYGNYFLGYDSASGKITMNSTTFCGQMHVEPNTPQTANCLSYYWNLCNDDAVDYYIDTVR